MRHASKTAYNHGWNQIEIGGIKMRKHASLLFIFSIILAIISLTIAWIISNIAFHLLPLDSLAAYQPVLTEILALLFWWGLDKTYFKSQVSWAFGTATKNWLYLLPIIVVLIGDATLNPSFNFGFSNIILSIILGLGVGIFEEYVFRGILVNQFYNRLNISALMTAVLSGLAFGFTHLVNALNGNFGNTVAQTLAAISLGFFFAVVYLLIHNLWLVIIAHAIIDAFDHLAFGTLSNNAGTSLTTGIIYFVVFAAIGFWLLRRNQVSSQFVHQPGMTVKSKSHVNFSGSWCHNRACNHQPG